jgi:exonuclease VII small subunit
MIRETIKELTGETLELEFIIDSKDEELLIKQLSTCLKNEELTNNQTSTSTYETPTVDLEEKVTALEKRIKDLEGVVASLLYQKAVEQNTSSTELEEYMKQLVANK